VHALDHREHDRLLQINVHGHARSVPEARRRIDWKYALGLPLADAGFDASVLCEFRARLIAGSRELVLLESLLDLCRKRGWLAARGRQRTDSTHVLAAIHGRNRAETVRETLRHTLDVLVGHLTPGPPNDG
jgi:transposase